MNRLILYSYIVLISCIFAACRGEEVVYPAQYERLPFEAREITSFAENEPIGMYVLNEGNMGSNKASIDYVDFVSGQYIRNIYTERNPQVIKELGDVGNDIQVYGSKLYAVINCSHKIEVMDAHSCKRIGQIDIPNCRFIRFANGKGYVSTYVGPVSIEQNEQLGAIYEIDTATLAVTRKVTVGYQPDELVISGKWLYVANSGGYRLPDYDCTVSRIDLELFKQVQKTPVVTNPSRLRMDQHGQIWVASRGKDAEIPSCIVVIHSASKDCETKEHGKTTNDEDFVVCDTLDIPCSEMVIIGDSLFFYGTRWNAEYGGNETNYGIIDVRTHKIVAENFITDGSETEIKVPYGLIVNPYNGDIYVTDAKNYVSSGMVHCYDKTGHKKWSVRTGDIPAHMCFVYR